MSAQYNHNTILLAENEVANIRNGIQAWLERRKEATGTKRQRRDPAAAIREATGASLMLDMGGSVDPDLVGGSSGQPARPLLDLDQSYLPCYKSLQDLKPMKLADLRMETHHRGLFLKVKILSPVISLALRSWAVVQDEGGDAERLELILHTTADNVEVLESGSNFYIREPYFTLNRQGDTVLRVDHPSDLVPIPGGEDGRDESRSDSPNESATFTEDAVLKLKEAGNSALKKNDLRAAFAMYSKALRISSNLQGAVPSHLTNVILRNRAHVNLLTGHFEQAKADALASLTINPDENEKSLNAKAYFRAGCAAYRLGEFEEAMKLSTEQQSLTPNDAEADLYLRRTTMRLKEQQTGQYNFSRLRSKYQSTADLIDAANYTIQTTIRESTGKGRGCFAECDFAAGSLVMCEKAFCIARSSSGQVTTALTYDTRDDQIRVAPVGLVKVLAEKLAKDPGRIARITDLDGGHSNVTNPDEGTSAVDTFRLLDIIRHNAFVIAAKNDQTKEASTGLWPYAAMMNHSCIPNVEPEFIGDLMIFRATRAIKAGEEILHCYDATRDYDARKTALKTTWDFGCNCALCKAEGADDVKTRKRREDLASKADAFVQRTSLPARRLAIVEARRLANAIDATYEDERYGGLPRNAARMIEAWLAAIAAR